MGSDTATPLHGTGGNLGRAAGRSDQGKAILHTIDPDFILGIGRISEFGSRKYHMRNFLMAPGMEWSRVYESGLRHLLLWWGGEEFDMGPNGEYGETDDPETNMKWSGMPHLLHAAWNIMVLYTYSQHEPYEGADDRPGKMEYEGHSWREWRESFDEVRGLTKQPEPEPLELAMPFEQKLAVLLAGLEELGFNAHSSADHATSAAFLNEHGETPHEVLGDYVAGVATQDEVKDPLFMKDPLRAFFALQNRKDATK